jgi:hypothetical protein
VPKGIFGSKRGDDVERWRKLHNLFSEQNIIKGKVKGKAYPRTGHKGP